MHFWHAGPGRALQARALMAVCQTSKDISCRVLWHAASPSVEGQAQAVVRHAGKGMLRLLLQGGTPLVVLLPGQEGLALQRACIAEQCAHAVVLALVLLLHVLHPGCEYGSCGFARPPDKRLQERGQVSQHT